MLTIADVQAHLERITYQPGWTITAYQGSHEGQHLVITTRVVDSWHPDETTTLDVHSALPPMSSTAELDRWLLWRLERIASHETREWYRVDGKPVCNPHAENADRDQCC